MSGRGIVTLFICAKCGAEKAKSHFPKRRRSETGYSDTCNSCTPNVMPGRKPDGATPCRCCPKPGDHRFGEGHDNPKHCDPARDLECVHCGVGWWENRENPRPCEAGA